MPGDGNTMSPRVEPRRPDVTRRYPPHVPAPRPSPLAALRTLRCVCIDLPRLLLPMAAARWSPQPTTTDRDGLALVQRPFFSLYNDEVARLPLYGPHMARSGHVHVGPAPLMARVAAVLA